MSGDGGKTRRTGNRPARESTTSNTLWYALVLPGRKSDSRAGFWPDCYRESTDVGRGRRQGHLKLPQGGGSSLLRTEIIILRADLGNGAAHQLAFSRPEARFRFVPGSSPAKIRPDRPTSGPEALLRNIEYAISFG